MDYITIYSTGDKNEVSVLKSVFDEENIDYKILREEDSKADKSNYLRQSFRVAEKDKSKASELLDQTGFLRAGSPYATKTSRMPGKKWILFFLAALILILVAILITWFMNVE